MIDEPTAPPTALPPPERPLLEAPSREEDGASAGLGVVGWVEQNQTVAMLGAFFVGVFAGVMLRS